MNKYKIIRQDDDYWVNLQGLKETIELEHKQQTDLTRRQHLGMLGFFVESLLIEARNKEVTLPTGDISLDIH